ncbi:MAG: 23S rRNA pseudouridine(1911/1915/1917) synthase RluD [Gammaproteobacteria bacterium]
MPKTIKLDIIIPIDNQGQRLDQALAQLCPEYSRARIQTWIKQQQVSVDGQACTTNKTKVRGGEHITIKAITESAQTWEAEAIPLDILHEDESILIINKPPGLVVHPAAGNREHTLVNALLYHAPGLSELPRAGVVHRLDKDTSGVMVVAKTLPAHTTLVRQLQARTVKREYLALVHGLITAGGTINAPIGRHPQHRTKQAVVASGKPAITHYRLEQRFNSHTLLRVQLETGRTHQIRVHMAHIHHPIVGDPHYSGRFKLAKGLSAQTRELLMQFRRQALHAQRLTLIHPASQTSVSFAAPIPADMHALLQHLEEDTHAYHP